MLNRSASLEMSSGVLKALPGKLDIKRHSPSILYITPTQKSWCVTCMCTSLIKKNAKLLNGRPKTLVNSENPGKMPHNAAFHHGPYCSLR